MINDILSSFLLFSMISLSVVLSDSQPVCVVAGTFLHVMINDDKGISSIKVTVSELGLLELVT